LRYKLVAATAQDDQWDGHIAGTAGPMSKAKPDRSGSSEIPRVISVDRVSSAELLGGKRELCIEHAGELYRLRITGNGKLILTK
jgi:hemin uptake protein HemP